ncbi:hypothetical protein A5637_04810 [Mycolicibacterium fortuitum]|nr:hypothetical protein A5637_04810 [Mycolicibacterium fortuitum]
MVTVSATVVAVVTSAPEQGAEEAALLVGLRWVLLRWWVLLRRRCRRSRRLGSCGIELRFGLRENFKLAPVEKYSAASGALVDLHPEPLHRQHL